MYDMPERRNGRPDRRSKPGGPVRLRFCAATLPYQVVAVLDAALDQRAVDGGGEGGVEVEGQRADDRPANSIVDACSPASKTPHAACGGGVRPSSTLAPLAAMAASGRDEITPLQPNQKTKVEHSLGRTYRALHRADIFKWTHRSSF
jgi:hypothetical protein